MDDGAPPVSTPSQVAPAPTERGWGKLLIAIAVFLFLPTIPQLRAVLPVEQTIVLFAPAVAACALVGWWAGGRAFLAVAWVAVAVLLTAAGATGARSGGFDNLARGWSLLLAGSFGLVCLLGMQRPLFARALLALGATLGLAAIMSVVGPVSASQASKIVGDEFARRNAETMSTLNGVIASHQKEWTELASKVPQLADLPTETDKELTLVSGWGRTVFPALLALQSLAALSLAWATYHRLGRARLGAPLKPLREFRFNDQLVWGLIVGLTILLLPTLTPVRDLGKNLLVFFGALYAIRGLGVLTWFMAPGSLGVALAVAFVLLWAPVLNAFAALAFMTLAVAALALGLGDTWADWRSRARSTM
jgi:FAD/FMN-containing dehydrogenase